MFQILILFPPCIRVLLHIVHFSKTFHGSNNVTLMSSKYSFKYLLLHNFFRWKRIKRMKKKIVYSIIFVNLKYTSIPYSPRDGNESISKRTATKMLICRGRRCFYFCNKFDKNLEDTFSHFMNKNVDINENLKFKQYNVKIKVKLLNFLNFISFSTRVFVQI